jgi:hypothetical protein
MLARSALGSKEGWMLGSAAMADYGTQNWPPFGCTEPAAVVMALGDHQPPQ